MHISKSDLVFVLPAFGCCILLLLVAKMVLTACNLCWWCFTCHQLVQRPHLHLQWAIPETYAVVLYFFVYIDTFSDNAGAFNEGTSNASYFKVKYRMR